MNRKNPFRGIACPSPNYHRRIDGARDTRRTFHGRYRDALITAILTAEPMDAVDHRDMNPIPCAFMP